MNPDVVLCSVILTLRDGSVKGEIYPTEALARARLDSIPWLQRMGELLDVASARLERTGIGLN